MYSWILRGNKKKKKNQVLNERKLKISGKFVTNSFPFFYFYLRRIYFPNNFYSYIYLYVCVCIYVFNFFLFCCKGELVLKGRHLHKIRPIRRCCPVPRNSVFCSYIILSSPKFIILFLLLFFITIVFFLSLLFILVFYFFLIFCC